MKFVSESRSNGKHLLAPGMVCVMQKPKGLFERLLLMPIYPVMVRYLMSSPVYECIPGTADAVIEDDQGHVKIVQETALEPYHAHVQGPRKEQVEMSMYFQDSLGFEMSAYWVGGMVRFRDPEQVCRLTHHEIAGTGEVVGRLAFSADFGERMYISFRPRVNATKLLGRPQVNGKDQLIEWDEALIQVHHNEVEAVNRTDQGVLAVL